MGAAIPFDHSHISTFSGSGARTCIGSFEVVDPSGHAAPERCAGAVEGTCLRTVTDPKLIARLEQLGGVEGYAVDPKLKVFTGWLIQLRKDIEAPELDADLAKGQWTPRRLP